MAFNERGANSQANYYLADSLTEATAIADDFVDAALMSSNYDKCAICAYEDRGAMCLTHHRKEGGRRKTEDGRRTVWV